MNTLQIICACIFGIWVFVTICFYDGSRAVDREDRSTPGYVLFLKHTPPSWRRITFWVLPFWIALFILALFIRK